MEFPTWKSENRSACEIYGYEEKYGALWGMYHLAMEGMGESDVLRVSLQIALGEYLIDEGFDLLGSSSWEIRVGRLVSITAVVSGGFFSVFMPGMLGRKVPWEEPFERIVGILREYLGVGGSDGMLVARMGG